MLQRAGGSWPGEQLPPVRVRLLRSMSGFWMLKTSGPTVLPYCGTSFAVVAFCCCAALLLWLWVSFFVLSIWSSDEARRWCISASVRQVAVRSRSRRECCIVMSVEGETRRRARGLVG